MCCPLMSTLNLSGTNMSAELSTVVHTWGPSARRVRRKGHESQANPCGGGNRARQNALEKRKKERKERPVNEFSQLEHQMKYYLKV